MRLKIFIMTSGMSIINDQIIDLDFSINQQGLDSSDIVRVIYTAVDYTNEYDHLLSVQDPNNFILFSTLDIFKIYKIYNFTKNEEYSLEGNFLIENNKVIYLDSQSGNNALIGLDQGDIIFANYITINDYENAAPVLTQSNNNFVTTAIEITPV